MSDPAHEQEPHVPLGSTLRHATTTELQRARVYVGNVNPGEVSAGFHDSLLALVDHDMANGWGCYVGKISHGSRANISKARNQVVTDFLDRTEGEWLLFADSDSVLPPDTIVRLLAAAQLPSEPAKIIGGLCVMVDDEGVAPTLYQHAAGDGLTRVQLDFPDNTVLQVAATGAACLMVHREVLEAYRLREVQHHGWLEENLEHPMVRELLERDLIHEPSPDNGYFQERVRRGRWVSEDVNFCWRLASLGYRVFVDCTLQIGHQKYGRIWTANDIRQHTSMRRRPVGVVIPTRQRSDLADDLVAALLEQGEADEIVVVDNGIPDEAGRAQFLDRPRVTLLDGQGLGINAMWNLGIEHLLEQHGRSTHIAILNDDIEIGPGFLGALSRALQSDNKLVAVSGNYDGRRRPGLVEEVRDICAGRYDQTGGFGGFAFMVNAAFFTGGYRFPHQCMWWYGDNDLVMAALDVGAKVGIALGASCVHIEGGGQSAGDVAWSDYEAQTTLDRAAFEKRWRTLQQARLRVQLGARAHTPTEGAPICVMTAIFGGYDVPWPLLAQDVECDAILITDDPELQVPGWRTVHWTGVRGWRFADEPPLPPRLAAKVPRCRPDRWTDAEHIVWLDGHLSVTSPSLIRELVAELGDGDIGAFRHHFHTTITEEAALASELPKYEGWDLQRQAKTYLEAGHPDDYGLWTTGVMVRRPRRTITFGNAWQDEIDIFGPEDQISLPWALRATGTEMVDLAFEGWWVGRRFHLHQHTDGTG